MRKCRDWRIFRVQFNMVHIFCMCRCTYAISLSGVREEEAKSSTNGVPRDSEREREREKERDNVYCRWWKKISFHQLLNDGRKTHTIRNADKICSSITTVDLITLILFFCPLVVLCCCYNIIQIKLPSRPEENNINSSRTPQTNVTK